MEALVVTPGVSGSLDLVEVLEPRLGADTVRVEVLEVGIDGTDKALSSGKHGVPPRGAERLIIGHECLGRVLEVGQAVQGLRDGDLVVPTVRRPCPEQCPPCSAGRVDLCSTGNYLERGIQRADGFAADVFVERPEWLVRVPDGLRRVAVLTEPLSIAVKGIERAYGFQREFPWEPKRALVLGAGSLGLLAALLLRARGLDVIAVDREEPDSPKARLVSDIGAHYVQADGGPLAALLGSRLPFDLVFEATGVASLIFQAMCLLGFNGVLCVAGLPEGNQRTAIPGDCIGLEMVLENRIFFGTVSSNRGHFERALATLGDIERRFPAVLGRIITGRFSLYSHRDAFAETQIKNVLVLKDA